MSRSGSGEKSKRCASDFRCINGCPFCARRRRVRKFDDVKRAEASPTPRLSETKNTLEVVRGVPYPWLISSPRSAVHGRYRTAPTVLLFRRQIRELLVVLLNVLLVTRRDLIFLRGTDVFLREHNLKRAAQF